MPRRILEEKLQKILAEDVGQGDITSALVVPSGTLAEARIVAKERGVLAGVEEVRILVESVGLAFESVVTDGERVKKNQTLARISGDARTILSVERTLLNILSRMSGIATATRDLIEKLESSGLSARVACTRKTAPGLLYFDKKAVLIGGGDTHRLHLDDMILIKDNHVVLAGGVEKAVARARENASLSKKIEVEVTRVEDVLTAVAAGADIIMLDNFAPRQVERAVESLVKKGVRKKILLEVSGGITRDNIVEFAAAGADLVSLGELTHSVSALDMSLEISAIKKDRST